MLGPEIGLPTYKDGLTNAFPNFTTSLDNSSPIKLSNSQKKLLNQLSQLEIQTDRQSCLVGQARVLTKNSGPTGCKYCGMCSFGCIYDSIFSSKNEIEKLVRENRIEYISSLRLISVEDFGEMARLNCINLVSGEEEVFACRVAFIAAGAVNSTKIALKSLGLEKEIIKFQKTGGFVRPYFSIKKLGLDWPNQNTQANVFMEIKDLSISKYWIHSQVSSPNEVVILGLGLLKDSFFQRILSPMRRFFLNHLVLVMTNVHSNEGPYYSISLSPNSKHAKFVGSLEIPKSYTSIEKRIERLIRRKLLSIGMISIPFAKKGVGNGPGYHIGSSMPMGGEGSISTNELGQLRSHKNIFFIDTSVLPCIPATTIGLFAMSNAHRITSKVLQSRDFE
jgi:hypothetical protein